MRYQMIHHVQLTMPLGAAESARAFYAGILELKEVLPPPEIAAKGRVWFTAGNVEIHVGSEPDHHPADVGHPALLLDGLAELRGRLLAEGHPVLAQPDFPGFDRFHTFDPFGNRIELMERR